MSTKKRTRRYRRTNQLRLESLETRIALHGEACLFENCAPDLHLEAVGLQSTRVSEELVVNLFTAGALTTDVDENDISTGDTIRLQLDPDDGPSNATLTPDGVFRWTPEPDQVGTFEFVVIAVDQGTPPLADAEVFTVEVLANEAPDLSDILDFTLEVNEDLEVNLSASDPEGDNLTFEVDPDQSPEGITIEQTDNNNAVLRWTPSAELAGRSITISLLVVDDGFPPMSDNEVFVVDIMSVVAVDDTYTLAADSVLTVDAASGVLANDSDIDNDALTATIVNQPTNGAVAFSSDGSFVYTPNAGVQGADTFTYQAQDGNGDTSTGTVTIHVNTDPVAADDSYTILEDTTLTVDVDSGLLANDSDAGGNSLAVSIGQQPASGTLDLNADGSFDYMPATEFSGIIEFTYVASDGLSASGEATVTIEVIAVNDAPIATIESYQVEEDRQLIVATENGLLANDSDVDSDSLSVELVDAPLNGTLTLDQSGGIFNGGFSYTPDENFNGIDIFTYTVGDGETSSSLTTTTINVQPINDAPLANPDSYSTGEDEILTVNAATGVLANDSDLDGDTLTAIVTVQPELGQLVFSSDGSFEYTPDQDANGSDDFSYQVSDGIATSDTIVVTLTVVASNDPPVANADSFEVSLEGTLNVSASEGVLVNDNDVEGDSLTASIVTQPANGTVSLSSDGSFTYQPVDNFSGRDTFSYQASDGGAQSSATVVTIEVANAEFGEVIVGAFTDPSLLGIRTDQVAGALPLNADHVITSVDYSDYSNPPTYGPHHGFLLDSSGNSITPRPTGVYQTEQPDEDLVHNLEHGLVWISYNPSLISLEDLAELEQLVRDGGTNAGVILTPRAANTDAIALASWARLLTLDRFDSVQVRTFIETNRGKAPEGYIPTGQKSDDVASESLTDGLPH